MSVFKAHARRQTRGLVRVGASREPIGFLHHYNYELSTGTFVDAGREIAGVSVDVELDRLFESAEEPQVGVDEHGRSICQHEFLRVSFTPPSSFEFHDEGLGCGFSPVGWWLTVKVPGTACQYECVASSKVEIDRLMAEYPEAFTSPDRSLSVPAVGARPVYTQGGPEW